ncbi:hypothetical protein [Streptomyces sp. NPDC029674]|uniref:hypothetical protein n=1 Tax=Streptomyces sp. NPDC029674 TaxID=3365297 RepID=UPI00384AB7A6
MRQVVVTVTDGAGGVPVRCPGCRREHLYVAPSYPCVCGAPVVPPLDRNAPVTPVTDRAWADEWITVRCGACGRRDPWPHPELDCACGAVLRVPVVGGPRAEPRDDGEVEGAGDEDEEDSGACSAPRARPDFRPVSIRDERDAVTVVALYLRWLGYLNTRSAARRPPSGARISARGMLAQVEPAMRPTTLRDIECLWLTAMTEAGDAPVACAFFSLAGYTPGARSGADALGVPLFTMDPSGTPRPVNGAAEALVDGGA